MPLYEFYCNHCGNWEEIQLRVFERDSYTVQCEVCLREMKRACGNKGGFRLGTNGSVGWSSDGYATTWGDSHKFKTGRNP